MYMSIRILGLPLVNDMKQMLYCLESEDEPLSREKYKTKYTEIYCPKDQKRKRSKKDLEYQQKADLGDDIQWSELFLLRVYCSSSGHCQM